MAVLLRSAKKYGVISLDFGNPMVMAIFALKTAGRSGPTYIIKYRHDPFS
ncbi:MAG: hypothetical protein PHP59_05080 [Methanofollis sp.]|nr:hypothetical protein [Methanofollis sp.]MDD4254733.1 hypothetical protein [Methanofollis sp.]